LTVELSSSQPELSVFVVHVPSKPEVPSEIN
jgi:hypothetical protein